MKKKEIEKELKYHKKWLKSLIDNEEYSAGVTQIEVKAEIQQLTWILKMFKK